MPRTLQFRSINLQPENGVIDSNLVVNGTANITGNTQIGGDLIVSDDVLVSGDINITGGLNVSETVTFSDGEFSGDLEVTGNVIISSDLEIEGNLDVGADTTLNNLIVSADAQVIGELNASGTIVTSETYIIQRKYISQMITQADLTAGATCFVNLTGLPSQWISMVAYVITTSSTTSSSGNTTGFFVQIGNADDPEIYMGITPNLLGAAGRFGGGVGIGSQVYENTPTARATFTATGGAPNCSHIDNLRLNVIIIYQPITT